MVRYDTYYSALSVCRSYPGIREQRVGGTERHGRYFYRVLSMSIFYIHPPSSPRTQLHDIAALQIQTRKTQNNSIKHRHTSHVVRPPSGFNHLSTRSFAPSSPPPDNMSFRYPCMTWAKSTLIQSVDSAPWEAISYAALASTCAGPGAGVGTAFDACRAFYDVSTATC